MSKKCKPLLKGDRDELGKYVREMADLLGLRDWTINVMDGTPENDQHAACVEVRYGRKWANIWFMEGWESEQPESLRATVCHELLHCHLKPTEWALNNVQLTLGTLAFGVLEGAYQDALETGVDAIATAWAETLPLPIKAKEVA